MAIITALVAAALVLSSAAGVRMIRESPVAHIGETEDLDHQSPGRDGWFVRFLDYVGLRAQRYLFRIYGPKRLALLDRKLKSAGNPEGLNLRLYVQRESGFIVLSVLLLLVSVMSGHTYLGCLVAAIFSGWMYLWLTISLRKRQSRIDKDLPDFLEVLAVVVRSGLPFRTALARVCERYSGPISDEMKFALHHMGLGIGRREAFMAVKERCDSPNMDIFVGTLLQSEELGTPIGDALTSIVKEIRRERGQQVRQAAGKAQPKVAFVATMTMLPGTLILMVGGALYANRDVLARVFGG